METAFQTLVPIFRYGLTLRVDFGNLAGGRDSGIDRCFALLLGSSETGHDLGLSNLLFYALEYIA